MSEETNINYCDRSVLSTCVVSNNFCNLYVLNVMLYH